MGAAFIASFHSGPGSEKRFRPSPPARFRSTSPTRPSASAACQTCHPADMRPPPCLRRYAPKPFPQPPAENVSARPPVPERRTKTMGGQIIPLHALQQLQKRHVRQPLAGASAREHEPVQSSVDQFRLDLLLLEQLDR